MLHSVLVLLVLLCSLQPGKFQSEQPTTDGGSNGMYRVKPYFPLWMLFLWVYNPMYIYSPAGVAEVFDEIKALLSTIKSKTNAHRREFHSFRDQIVGDLRILREDLSNLNDSVNTFSLQQQKHKQQTKAELARLHTSLNTTQSSLTQQVKAKLNTLTANLTLSYK